MRQNKWCKVQKNQQNASDREILLCSSCLEFPFAKLRAMQTYLFFMKNGGMIRKKTNNSFYFLWFLFIWANISFNTLRSPNDLKLSARFRFSHKFLLERKQESMILRHLFFHFQSFETFLNIEVGFSINLSKCF